MDFSEFQTTCWTSVLGRDRKLHLLGQLEEGMAKKQGRKKKRNVIEITNEEDGALLKEAWGAYNPDTPCKLYINPCCLDSTDAFINYTAINTVIHEGRHAYQDDTIHADKKHGHELNKRKIDMEKMELWKLNLDYSKECGGFKDDDKAGQRFQPIEDDAHYYTFRKMNHFKKQFLGDSVYYDTYMRELSKKNAELRDEAISQYKTKKYRRRIIQIMIYQLELLEAYREKITIAKLKSS
ncbi:MAG: hypothetical protein LBH62_01425 [Nitrososphaerota archaeon]|jgi:hypothetical protein|nr:hypothetical protein [Nitrososphaerota archaeon]